ncbi:MAG: HAMP domain-containing histidine kinase [Campylobacteraceae bacterium]|nr:HAMP domain-containing histidine kinase [Campylobacteraceae bacterium]
MNNKLEDTISILEKTKIDLNEQKDLFEALFKGTSDGLALIEDGKTIHSNYSLLKMYKVDNISFLDTYKFGSLSPKIQPNGKNSIEVYKEYLNLCKVNNYSSYDSLVYKSTGEEFWVNIILIKIETNKRNLIYSITRDISEKRFLEEEIQNKANDLALSNNELEDSNEELQTTIQNLKLTQEQLISSEKMAALGALVAGVAHEINTPVGIGLTGISHLEDSTKIIYDKYNKDEMSQEEFEEYLGTAKDLSSLVYKNLEKAASLVKSFKQVAVDQSSEAKRVFDIKEYLHEILQSIHSVTKKTNIDIEVSCPSGIKINSYAGAYSQIISNLIMNSLIHGFKEKEKGNIFITVKKEDKELKIIYKDTGKGIKEENLSKIFDPFFTTNRDNGGSGLGLNIIYNIIMSRLNGSIKCNSQENKGVEFIIILNI